MATKPKSAEKPAAKKTITKTVDKVKVVPPDFVERVEKVLKAIPGVKVVKEKVAEPAKKSTVSPKGRGVSKTTIVASPKTLKDLKAAQPKPMKSSDWKETEVGKVLVDA